MGLAAGNLRDRVTILYNQAIEDAENHRDGFGQPIDSWVPLLTKIAANVFFKNGAQFISQNRDQSRGVASVRIRYRIGIKSTMRVQIGDDIYKMTSPPLVSQCKTYMDLAIDEINDEDEAP
jgi:SPP1 family predicted phage head-tail adaptor